MEGLVEELSTPRPLVTMSHGLLNDSTEVIPGKLTPAIAAACISSENIFLLPLEGERIKFTVVPAIPKMR